MNKSFSKKIETNVEQLLKQYPITRSDNDADLYNYYLSIYCGIDTSIITFNEICGFIKAKKIPSWKTVGRQRQILQGRYPELKTAKSKIKRKFLKPQKPFIIHTTPMVKSKPFIKEEPEPPLKRPTTKLPKYVSPYPINP